MANEPPSVLLTYVRYHDVMASEHWHLFRLLRLLLKDSDQDALRTRQIRHLTDFLDMLAKHHETENAMLNVVCPANLQAHLQDHRDLSEAIAEILANCQSLTTADMQTRVANILASLKEHVATLDRELAQFVDSASPA